jgi:hypothetical protein
MAVAAHDGPSLGKIAPQTSRTHSGRVTIPVNHHQPAAGQGQLQHIRQPQGIGRARGPVVVPTHRNHRTVAFSARQGACVQHVAGVRQDVAAIQHPAQRFRHRAMGVGNQADAHGAGPSWRIFAICQLTPIDTMNFHGMGL